MPLVRDEEGVWEVDQSDYEAAIGEGASPVRVRVGAEQYEPASAQDYKQAKEEGAEDVRDVPGWEAVGLGALQGPTFGFSDEILAGLSTLRGGDYDESVEAIRKKQREAQEAHPWKYGLSEMGASMILPGALGAKLLGKAPGLVKAGQKGAGAAGQAFRAGASGAAEGALTGVGLSEDKERALQDMLTGSTTGLLTGAFAPTLAKGVKKGFGTAARKLGKKAEEQSFEAMTGATGQKKLRREMEPYKHEIGRAGLEGAVDPQTGKRVRAMGFGSGAQSIQRRADEALDIKGEELGGYLDEADQQINKYMGQVEAMPEYAELPPESQLRMKELLMKKLGVDRTKIAQRLRDEAEKLKKYEYAGDEIKKLQKKAKRFGAMGEERGGMSFREAKAERAGQRKLGMYSPTEAYDPGKEAAQKVYRTIEDEIREQMGRIGTPGATQIPSTVGGGTPIQKELLEKYIKANKDYASLKSGSRLAGGRAAAEVSRNPTGLTANIIGSGATAGMAVNPLARIGAQRGVAHGVQQMFNRYRSTAAVTLDAMSKLIDSPVVKRSLEKAQRLSETQNIPLAAAHATLMMQDPEYGRVVNTIQGEGDETGRNN